MIARNEYVQVEPENICNYGNLQGDREQVIGLRINFEETNGEFPEDVYDMHGLEHLTLTNYPHNYQLLDKIKGLTELTSVVFKPRIPLTKIPQQLLDMPLKKLKAPSATITIGKAFESLEVLCVSTANSDGTVKKISDNSPNLKTLEFTALNNMTLTFPSEIVNLPNLENLSINGIFANMPPEMKGMKHLKRLFWNPNVSFEIKDDLVEVLAMFDTVEIINGDIRLFPESFGLLKQLKTLKLFHGINGYLHGRYVNDKVNHYNPVTVPKCFAGLENLEELDLAFCAINDISPLANLKNLKHLNLSMTNNVLVGGEDFGCEYSALEHLVNLESLDMNSSYLNSSHIKYIKNMQGLRCLKLNHCYDVVDFSFLEALPQLEILDFDAVFPKSLTPIMQHPTLKKITANHFIMQLWGNRETWENNESYHAFLEEYGHQGFEY